MTGNKSNLSPPPTPFRECFPALTDPDCFTAGEPLGWNIAFSGGCDSAVTVDMAVTIAEDADLVRPFMMTLLPDLDYTRFWVDYAKKRWGVTVDVYQHWALNWYIRRGVFRKWADTECPRRTLPNVEQEVRAHTGMRWIGYGYKSADSLQRRGMMNQWENGISQERSVFAPLKGWSTNRVRIYLENQRIVQPTLEEYQSHGINLSPACMHWLRKFWLGDYKRMLKAFPLAVAQADRYVPPLRTGKRPKVNKNLQLEAPLLNDGVHPDGEPELELDESHEYVPDPVS